MRAFLSLGSNVGDRQANLEAAVRALRRLDRVVAVSPVYETEPVGGPASQPPYLNAVVELDTRRSARQLLEELCRPLEDDAGRVRAERWGPRPLDVDVLLAGDDQRDEADLEVPHPRMWDRRFVLAPLADLAPDLVPDDVLARAQGAVRRTALVIE